MRLLKIIIVVFLIYFIRRFIQMYKTMKSIQDQQMRQNNQPPQQEPPAAGKNKTVVDADFKILD